MKDDSLHPAKCCKQPLPQEDAQDELPPDLITCFEGKKEELDCKGHERVYCHVPICSASVSPTIIQGTVATCAKCTQATRTLCKVASHAGGCSRDGSLEKTKALAKEIITADVRFLQGESLTTQICDTDRQRS